MRKKLLIIILVSIIGLFFLWVGFLWKIFSCDIAGSFPCVETWNLNIKEGDLIEIIKEIKKEHPELEPPNVSSPTSGRHEYWYDVDFYYADTKEDVQAWTRPCSDSSMTTLAFVAIFSHFDSLTPVNEIKSDRREINRDFGYFENRREIGKFRNRILKLIEQKIAEPHTAKKLIIPPDSSVNGNEKNIVTSIAGDSSYVVLSDIDSSSIRVEAVDYLKIGDLSADEIKEVSRIFDQCLKEHKRELHPSVRNRRQYVPYLNSKGERKVWVNCFCDSEHPYWRKRKVMVKDGGACYFNFKINLGTKKYYDLRINGVG